MPITRAQKDIANSIQHRDVPLSDCPGMTPEISMQSTGTLTLTIQPFDGEPSMLNFFFGQLEDSKKFNNLTDDRCIALMKSKLCGNALKYFIECPSFKNAKNLEQAKIIFSNFFSTESNAINVTDLSNIKLLNNESIKSLAHRIDVAADKLYGNIDSDALNKIKYVHFINALSPETKCKLFENSITTYDDAQKFAQKCQDAQLSAALSLPTPAIDKITLLQEQINALQSTNKLVCQLCDTQGHDAKSCKRITSHHPRSNNNYSQHNVRSRPYQRNHNNNSRQIRERCQFCFKYGHTLSVCRHFLRQQNTNNSQQNNVDNRQNNRQNNRGNLNAQ